MCILFCEILFSTDLGTEYECNHWISYPKQQKKVLMFLCESPHISNERIQLLTAVSCLR